MPNYVSTLTGQQINDVMTQIDQGVPEGWAVGEKNGIPVSPPSPYYHNNAKYYAENALDSANRAEAAVPAGTAGAVFFDRSQTLTDAQAMQARANIVAGGSNPNLLDNPFFEVNQRSFSSTSSGGTYTVDRWRVGTVPTGGVVSLSNGVITIDASAVTSSYVGFDQRTVIDLAGKTVTLSCMASDGTIYQGTAVVPARSTSAQTAISISVGVGTLRYYVTATGVSYAAYIQLRIAYGHSFAVKAVKLEIGSVSTLANDTAPTYQQELAKCQRYFVRLSGLYSVLGMGRSAVVNTMWVSVPLPVSLRATPTISFTGCYLVTDSGFLSVTNITMPDNRSYSANQITLICAVSSLATGNVGQLQIRDATGHLDLSADL